MADKEFDIIRRGVKRPSPAGTATFVGLRAADIFIQYGILFNDVAAPLLDYLNINHVSSLAYTAAPGVALGLPLKPLIILSMAAGTAIKQIFWVTSISEEEMPVSNAISIAVFNTLFNGANSILSLTAAASYFTPSPLSPHTLYEANEASPLFVTGTALFILGTLTETLSEIQRKQFKKDPKNAGKPFTGGLFGAARHINYGAYSIMRAGYAMAAGGWIWGSFIGAWFLADFTRRGVPVLDGYCTKRYGVAWEAYKQKVPSILIPGIW